MKKGMKPGLIVLLVIVGIALIIGMAFVTYHNKFVNADENINKQWAQIQTQYQRRADLIPNLVETVKGYAAHEEKVLVDLTAMRSRYSEATSPEELEQVDQDFQRAINVVVEAYPDLKANENFLALQAELAGTENRIAVARRDFNEAVGSYNKMVRTFPGNFFAGIFGFSTRDMFQAQEGAETVPSVGF